MHITGFGLDLDNLTVSCRVLRGEKTTYLCAAGRSAHVVCTAKTQVSVGHQVFFPLQINGTNG